MSNVVLIGNNRATRDAFVPPPTLHEDNTPYRWRMFYANGAEIADSDELAPLIGVLIPGYEELDELGKASARLRYAQSVQRSLRANILSNLTPEQLDALTEREHLYLSWEALVDPDFADDEGTPFVWKQEIPLVLIDAHYEPIGVLTPPLSSEGDFPVVSNILWLHTVDELSFLVSLTHAGVITFGAPRAVHQTPAALRDD